MSMEPDFTSDLSDEDAIAILTVEDPDSDDVARAVTHLEVSINGGDRETVRGIALTMLTALEAVATSIIETEA